MDEWTNPLSTCHLSVLSACSCRVIMGWSSKKQDAGGRMRAWGRYATKKINWHIGCKSLKEDVSWKAYFHKLHNCINLHKNNTLCWDWEQTKYKRKARPRLHKYHLFWLCSCNLLAMLKKIIILCPALRMQKKMIKIYIILFVRTTYLWPSPFLKINFKWGH